VIFTFLTAITESESVFAVLAHPEKLGTHPAH
jgi:hypothetical protein